MSKGREFLEKIYALEEDGDVRAFYDEAFGVFGDDIDDSVDRVGAPKSTAWAADHFNPLIC